MWASIRAGEGATAMSCSCATSAGGAGSVAAVAVAQQREAASAMRVRCMVVSPGKFRPPYGHPPGFCHIRYCLGESARLHELCVGKACDSTGKFRGSPSAYKKKKT